MRDSMEIMLLPLEEVFVRSVNPYADGTHTRKVSELKSAGWRFATIEEMKRCEKFADFRAQLIKAGWPWILDLNYERPPADGGFPDIGEAVNCCISFSSKGLLGRGDKVRRAVGQACHDGLFTAMVR